MKSDWEWAGFWKSWVREPYRSSRAYEVAPTCSREPIAVALSTTRVWFPCDDSSSVRYTVVTLGATNRSVTGHWRFLPFFGATTCSLFLLDLL